MDSIIKDLERYRRHERQRQRIILKAQRDMLDYKNKNYWEDTLEGFLKGAIFTITFLGLCCTLGYIFAKLTL